MTIDQLAILAVSTADVPLEELCAAYAAAGFRNVELPLGQIRQYLAGGKSVEDARRLFARSGLRFIGGSDERVICFGDDAARERSHARTLASADLIAQLRGGVLVVATDGPAEGANFVALDAIGRTLVSLAEKIPPTISIALEFSASPPVRSLKSARIVADVARHERVGILFDVAHYYCTPSRLEDLTPAVVERILHVHVSDVRDVPGDLCDCDADRVLPGEGCLDLRALLGKIESLGYRGCFSLELVSDEIRQLPIAAASRRCFEAMKTLL